LPVQEYEESCPPGPGWFSVSLRTSYVFPIRGRPGKFSFSSIDHSTSTGPGGSSPPLQGTLKRPLTSLLERVIVIVKMFPVAA
jgi:hypothetical protein